MIRDLELEKRLAARIVGDCDAEILHEELRYLLNRSQHAADLDLVAIEARELIGEADATGTIPQTNINALRSLLWRASLKGRRQDAGSRADNYKHLGGQHIQGA